MSGEHLQIGAVAEQLGLSVRTLHHWEEQGLVTPSARSAGGFRLYTADDVHRLVTVRRMKPMGFSLEEMRQLLEAMDTLRDPAASGVDRTRARAFVDACREQLTESRRELEQRLDWADELAATLAELAG